MTTLYTSKHPIVTIWEFNKDLKRNEASSSIPAGTLFSVISIGMNGLCLQPVDDSVNTENMILEYSDGALSVGFTETDATGYFNQIKECNK